MSWGPVPSQLCLLSSLRDRAVGDKVRFLGCVTSYSTTTARLTVGHMYPPGTNETASVDIKLALETIKPGVTSVGEWVNVLGYITEKLEMDSGAPARAFSPPVSIQALLVWPTGPLDIGSYEKTFEENKKGD